MGAKGSGYRTAVLVSVLLHGGIIGLLVSGWHPEFKPRKMQQSTYIEAALLQVDAPPAGKRPPAKTKPVSQPKPDPQETQRRQQAVREEAVKRAAQEKAAQEKAIAEKAAQAKAKAAQEKVVKDKLVKDKLAKEKLAKEKLASEKAAAEKAAKEKAAKEKAAKEKIAGEKAAAEKVAREKAAAEQAAKAKAAADAAREQAAARGQMVATYESYVRDRIAGNWNRPPSARRDMQVELQVRLVPTGQVMGVSVTRSSGDPAFDQSAVNAVQQVGRFDRLQELSRKDPLLFEQNFRTLNLTFRPEDLRL